VIYCSHGKEAPKTSPAKSQDRPQTRAIQDRRHELGRGGNEVVPEEEARWRVAEMTRRRWTEIVTSLRVPYSSPAPARRPFRYAALALGIFLLAASLSLFWFLIRSPSWSLVFVIVGGLIVSVEMLGIARLGQPPLLLAWIESRKRRAEIKRRSDSP
jgi:hypothetical protein